MLRSLLIYLSQADWMRRYVMRLKIARKVALRFVAGETLEAAIAVVKDLNQELMFATLDQLGEHTLTADQANSTTVDVIRILDAIDQAGVSSGLSVKLTQIGLLLDEELCASNLAKILQHAANKNLFVRIDMEDTSCTDATFRIYRKMRLESGFTNLGMVLQSYLYRSVTDTNELLSEGTRIRMVKGAYKEPGHLAFPKKVDVDKSFIELTKLMLNHARNDSSPAVTPDGKYPPVTALGTHDKNMIDAAIAYANQIGVPKEKLEIQMLYGIRRDLQKELVSMGYPVRIYVPFGTEWYPYFMRRLAERPANLWFFISSLLKS